MLRAGSILAALAAVTAFGVAPAAAGVSDVAAVKALEGLTQAVDSGRLPQADAARYRAIVRRSVSVVRRLPGARAANLAAVLAEVAARSPAYTAPRALALFSMLDVNTRYLGSREAPRSRVDIQGPDRVVYRFVSGRGFQFHPLAEFGALNADLAAGRTDEARRLVYALLARAVPAGAALTWEYYFRFSGGRPPWTSGMAQAVAAQALARASQTLDDSSLVAAARSAYLAIDGRLVLQLRPGPWIRLYSFNRDAVLNAQLQAAISVGDYAEIAADQSAEALAAGLRAAAAALLTRFDTGFWSLYSLAGDASPLEYHQYVISLLRKLAAGTRDQLWSDAATRFQSYLTQPPAFQLGDPPAPLVRPLEQRPKARPLRATISFWLSKPSAVALDVGGEPLRLRLDGGWERVTWNAGSRPPGVYGVRLSATDLAGNSAQVDLLPIVIVPAVP